MEIFFRKSVVACETWSVLFWIIISVWYFRSFVKNCVMVQRWGTIMRKAIQEGMNVVEFKISSLYKIESLSSNVRKLHRNKWASWMFNSKELDLISICLLNCPGFYKILVLLYFNLPTSKAFYRLSKLLLLFN